MPSRRRFLATCCSLSTVALPIGTASGKPSSGPVERESRPETVDLTATVDAFTDLGERVFGRVDMQTARRLREAAPSVEPGTTTELDRRLAPVLGRGRDAPAGLRSLSGELDPETAIRRLRRGATVERLGVAGDRAVYTASTDRGRATLGTDGTDFVVDAGDSAVAATIAGEDGALDPAAGTVVDGLRDADAFTGATVAEAAGEQFPRGHPARAVLPEVAAFGLAVDATGDQPVLRGRVVATGDEPLSAAETRALFGTVGVPAGLLADATVTTDGRATDLRAPLAGQEGTQAGIALVFLVLAVAVAGTFVLGLGSRPPPAPQVALGFDHRNDGRVTITHEGGDTLGTDGQVVVAYTHGGETTTETWRDADGISAGDSFTTSRPPDPGTPITVTWHGESRTVLAEYDVPE